MLRPTCRGVPCTWVVLRPWTCPLNSASALSGART